MRPLSKNSVSPLRTLALPTVGLLVACVSLFITLIPLALRPVLDGIPANPHSDITIDTSGKAVQDGVQIAQAVPTLIGSQIRIHLNNEVLEESTFLYNRVLLPNFSTSQGAEQWHIESIQGSQNFRVQLLPGKGLLLNFPTVLPESHTILVIDFAPNYLHPGLLPILATNIIQTPITNWLIIGLSIIAFAGLLASLAIRSATPHTAELQSMPPNDISPMDLGILRIGRLEVVGVSALIYDLASRGFLQIVETPDETYFFRTQYHEDIPFHEEILLKLLVGPKNTSGTLTDAISTLTHDLFSSLVNSTFIETYSSLKARGYFIGNPRSTHLRFKTVGIITQLLCLLQALGAYFFLSSQAYGIILLGLAGYAVGWLIYKSGYRIISLSPAGIECSRKCGAFVNYLSSPDAIGHEGSQGMLFYHYLPYALVMGVQQEWLNRFRNINFYIPEWYSIEQAQLYGPAQFNMQVTNITQALATVFLQVKDPNVD